MNDIEKGSERVSIGLLIRCILMELRGIRGWLLYLVWFTMIVVPGSSREMSWIMIVPVLGYVVRRFKGAHVLDIVLSRSVPLRRRALLLSWYVSACIVILAAMCGYGVPLLVADAVRSGPEIPQMRAAHSLASIAPWVLVHFSTLLLVVLTALPVFLRLASESRWGLKLLHHAILLAVSCAVLFFLLSQSEPTASPFLIPIDITALSPGILAGIALALLLSAIGSFRISSHAIGRWEW
jgi:hypothetical protein